MCVLISAFPVPSDMLILIEQTRTIICISNKPWYAHTLYPCCYCQKCCKIPFAFIAWVETSRGGSLSLSLNLPECQTYSDLVPPGWGQGPVLCISVVLFTEVSQSGVIININQDSSHLVTHSLSSLVRAEQTVLYPNEIAGASWDREKVPDWEFGGDTFHYKSPGFINYRNGQDSDSCTADEGSSLVLSNTISQA